MANASLVGIRYSKKQEIVRCIIHFDHDAHEYRHELDTLPGEAWVTIPRSIYETFTHHQHIHDHLGLKGQPGITDRCIVHDERGIVLHVGCYDPDIDTHPHGTIKHHPHAIVGDSI